VHLIQQLAALPGGPALHVTGIDISTGNELSESKASAMFVGRLLSRVAAQFGVPFTFTGMGATMTSFRPSLFEVQEGEALFVTSNIGTDPSRCYCNIRTPLHSTGTSACFPRLPLNGGPVCFF